MLKKTLGTGSQFGGVLGLKNYPAIKKGSQTKRAHGGFPHNVAVFCCKLSQRAQMDSVCNENGGNFASALPLGKQLVRREKIPRKGKRHSEFI